MNLWLICMLSNVLVTNRILNHDQKEQFFKFNKRFIDKIRTLAYDLSIRTV